MSSFYQGIPSGPVDFSGDVTINGDLDVFGTVTSVAVQNLEVKDNFLNLAVGATGGTHVGGLAINHETIATSNVAGSAITATTVEVVDGSLFTQDDIIELVNLADDINEGRYAVASVLGNVITIKTSNNNFPILKNSLTPDAVVQGTVSKISISAIRSNTAGGWEVTSAQSSDASPFVWFPIASDKLGEIKSSLLTEAQWNTISGAGWVLADGRSVAGTPYAILTGNSNVPDLRGQFLRGKNNGRADGKQNPDGEVALGAYSADKTGTPTTPFTAATSGSHNHTVNSAGDHTHSIYTYYTVYSSTHRAGNYPAGAENNNQAYSLAPNDTLTTAGSHTHTMNSAGNHTHTISGGDNETAPKNVAVNYFVFVGA